MSNEELCILIQAGKTELLGELWEQVQKLVEKHARYMLLIVNRPTMELDDLKQSGFLAFLYAVDHYSSDVGAKFSTYLCLCLKNAFRECLGIRTNKQKQDPINWAASLSHPLANEPDSGKLFDIVPDPDADIPMETVEAKLWHKQLQEALEKALSVLPERCAEVLRMRYYQGLTLSEIGQSKNCSLEMVRQIERKGIRLLQQPKTACNLLPFYQYDFYAKTGLTAFRETGLSVQERFLLDSEARQERAERRQKAQNEMKHKKQFDEMMAQIDKEVAEQVSRMTEEEKAQLLAKYDI